MSYYYPGYNNYSCTTTGNCIPNPYGEFSDLITCQQSCSNYLNPYNYNPYNDNGYLEYPYYRGYGYVYGYVPPFYNRPYHSLGGGYPYHGRNYSKFVGRGGNWPGGRGGGGGGGRGGGGRGGGGGRR
jgi:hypothetical protein